LKTFLEGATDGHGFTDALHLRGEGGVGGGEFLEGEARDLGDDVVDGGLEAGGGLLGDVVLEFVEGSSGSALAFCRRVAGVGELILNSKVGGVHPIAMEFVNTDPTQKTTERQLDGKQRTYRDLEWREAFELDMPPHYTVLARKLGPGNHSSRRFPHSLEMTVGKADCSLS
jgi:hypothetical protein